MENVEGCSGCAETAGGTVGSTALRAAEHDHLAGGDERAIWAEAAQALKKRESDDPGSTPQQLVPDVTDGSPEGVRAKRPAQKRLKAIFCDARGAAEIRAVRDAEEVAQPPACATNLQSLCVPARLRRSDGEGNFLLYNRGAGSDRLLVSAAQPKVDFPRRSPNRSADDAFRAPPRIWQRLYTLRVSKGGFHMPRLRGRLPDKTEATYCRSWMAALNLFGAEQPSPATTLTDLEPGARLTAKET